MQLILAHNGRGPIVDRQRTESPFISTPPAPGVPWMSAANLLRMPEVLVLIELVEPGALTHVCNPVVTRQSSEVKASPDSRRAMLPLRNSPQALREPRCFWSLLLDFKSGVTLSLIIFMVRGARPSAVSPSPPSPRRPGPCPTQPSTVL